MEQLKVSSLLMKPKNPKTVISRITVIELTLLRRPSSGSRDEVEVCRDMNALFAQNARKLENCVNEVFFYSLIGIANDCRFFEAESAHHF